LVCAFGGSGVVALPCAALVTLGQAGVVYPVPDADLLSGDGALDEGQVFATVDAGESDSPWAMAHAVSPW
jgi:hypothetical protein